MSETGLPFDDFRALLRSLPGRDAKAAEAVRHRLAAMAGDPASFGRLGEIAAWLAGWRKRAAPVMRPELALFAGTHGIAEATGADASIAATQGRIDDLAAGKAAAGALCLSADIGLKVYDLALDLPTADIRHGASLDERGCAATMAFGMEAIAGGTDLFCLSAVEGGDIAAAALLATLLGLSAAECARSPKHVALVHDALDAHKGSLGDPLEAMRRLGGRETAALAGAMLAARMERIPLIIEGRAALAAAAVLHRLDETALDHCLLAAASKGDEMVAGQLGLKPLLDLGIATGEGVSALLAAGIVRSAAQLSAAPGR